MKVVFESVSDVNVGQAYEVTSVNRTTLEVTLKDYEFPQWAELVELRAENEKLKQVNRDRSEQIGVACFKHDLVHDISCGRCADELRAENEKLKAEYVYKENPAVALELSRLRAENEKQALEIHQLIIEKDETFDAAEKLRTANAELVEALSVMIKALADNNLLAESKASAAAKIVLAKPDDKYGMQAIQADMLKAAENRIIRTRGGEK